MKSAIKIFFLIIILIRPSFSQGHLTWSYDKTIYELNTRCFTSEGTFAAVHNHLDRLKELGVGIIWFMPIHPIGVQNRLGSLGSPYSVKDYYDVNPEYGTMENFKELVDSIHARGMYVIIDWVANHTSWDNVLTVTNPEYYETDGNGNFIPPPGTNWSDVIQLDYSNTELRQYMKEALAYWINETGIDGFRFDAVSFIPNSFWISANSYLKSIKPDIFLLAEGDDTDYPSLAFDMSYAWGMHGWGSGVLKKIYQGTNDAGDLTDYMNSEFSNYSTRFFRMYFTSNHDENAWEGTVFEQLGASAEACAVLTGTIGGMQLIYNGQEAGLNKRLAFFDKDEIPWQSSPFEEIYTKLNSLKKENQALWNGTLGSRMKKINTNNDDKFFVFTREKEDNKILAVFNFSGNELSVQISDTNAFGIYEDVFTGDTLIFSSEKTITLSSWDYLLYKLIDMPVSVEENQIVISNFKLYQNYPNPFFTKSANGGATGNPTTIRFSIPNVFARSETTKQSDEIATQPSVPRNDNVRLTIYNALGQQVSELINKPLSTGNYEVEFNSTNLPSGIYFYRLQSGNFVDTKKMILLK